MGIEDSSALNDNSEPQIANADADILVEESNSMPVPETIEEDEITGSMETDTDMDDIPENIEVHDKYKSFVEKEWLHFYRNIWYRLKDKFWLNSPIAIDRAKDKLMQLDLAQLVLYFAQVVWIMTFE